MEMITAELTTYPWVYTTHKGMEMITVELTTCPLVYITHKGMEMITAELKIKRDLPKSMFEWNSSSSSVRNEGVT